MLVKRIINLLMAKIMFLLFRTVYFIFGSVKYAQSYERKYFGFLGGDLFLLNPSVAFRLSCNDKLLRERERELRVTKFI